MQITVFSFFTSMVWSSLLVAIIYLFRKKCFFMKQFGIASLIFLYLFCITRMVIPFELPFTKVLTAKGAFSTIYRIVGINKIGISNVSILLLLFIIWIVVSVILLVRFAYQYFVETKEISSYLIRVDGQCTRVFKKVMHDSNIRMKIDIRHTDTVKIPMGIGILKKSIILPNEDYSDSELYYILLHEYTHFLNRDLFTKMLIHIFCCIFWWNPVVYLLRKDLNQTLEIKCDLCITEHMDNGSKVDYLTTIVSTLKKISTKKTSKTFYGTVALVAKDYESEIVERFRMISEKHNFRNKSKASIVVWLLIFWMIFISSYSFVVQPYYDVSREDIETGADTHEIRPDNSYIIKNKDGTYTLYFLNEGNQNIDEEFALRMKSQGFEILEEK